MPGATSSKHKLDFLEVTAESIRVTAGSICHLRCLNCNSKEKQLKKQITHTGQHAPSISVWKIAHIPKYLTNYILLFY